MQGMGPPQSYHPQSYSQHYPQGNPFAQANPYAGNPFASSSTPSHSAEAKDAPEPPPPPLRPPMTSHDVPPSPEPNAYCQEPGGMTPSPGCARCIVKLPKPRYAGSTEFFGNLPKKAATFAWSEMCATAEPESSLAPVPQVPQKQWYNTYMYVPERTTHSERQFLERFTRGPDGEWLDVVKARRMSNFYEDQRLQQLREKMERSMVMAGTNVTGTQYTDAYTGEHLVACSGELLPKRVLLDEYNLHTRSAELKEMLQVSRESMDFDNLRIAWPFGNPHRNKKISPHTYEWFDRRNPSIQGDRSFEIIELPSQYVDRESYDTLYAGGAKAHEMYQDAQRVWRNIA